MAPGHPALQLAGREEIEKKIQEERVGERDGGGGEDEEE